MSPDTFCNAEANAVGRPVSSAPARSALSSRYRDNMRVSRKLTAYTITDTASTAMPTNAVF